LSGFFDFSREFMDYLLSTAPKYSKKAISKSMALFPLNRDIFHTPVFKVITCSFKNQKVIFC
jgi:hypothetical protein